ncbi:PAAR domain-containing protein [Burkholderia pyrrocinia]|uniref:PAAR domain-containing protein n=1 Tax=Burkholderia pyrrocinia TaxID=60550 RepID=UPI00215A68C1|nr:PAAR domain-containing protein [Burkholderia pyrrocinia]UVE63938.1 PAAR domain-containing protein [Burkholderia pyrrocinia]
MNDEHEAPTHLFATIGALTERGGRVTAATSGMTLAGLEVARVGDVVTYDDGSEATIIDGAGNCHSAGKSFALVGSRLSNGDRIIETLRTSWGIHVPEGQSIPGLFDPAYVPPAHTAHLQAGGTRCDDGARWRVTRAVQHMGSRRALGQGRR